MQRGAAAEQSLRTNPTLTLLKLLEFVGTCHILCNLQLATDAWRLFYYAGVCLPGGPLLLSAVYFLMCVSIVI